MKGGKSTAESNFQNTPGGFAGLQKWLQHHGSPLTRAGLEATGHYSNGLLRFLHDGGHHASLINPRRIKDYARSEGRLNKTDPADARVIARFINTQAPPAWRPPGPAQAQLRVLQRRRAQVMQMLVSERLHLEATEDSLKPLVQETVRHLEEQMETLKKRSSTLIEADARLSAQLELLLSIPGVGPVTAGVILAELPAVEDFKRVRDIAAWAGLTPSLFESGSSVRGRARMSKQGNGRLRQALYMPAVTLLRASGADNALKASGRRLLAAGKPRMVVVGALMRKLLQVACGVLKHGKPFDAKTGMVGEAAATAAPVELE